MSKEISAYESKLINGRAAAHQTLQKITAPATTPTEKEHVCKEISEYESMIGQPKSKRFMSRR